MMTIGETQVMVDWNKMHCQKKKKEKKYKLPFCGTAKESVVNMFVVYRNITFNIQVNDYKSAVIIRYQLMVFIVLWQYAKNFEAHFDTHHLSQDEKYKFWWWRVSQRTNISFLQECLSLKAKFIIYISTLDLLFYIKQIIKHTNKTLFMFFFYHHMPVQSQERWRLTVLKFVYQPETTEWLQQHTETSFPSKW